MSLLESGCNEDVVVYPEEVVTDRDGNERTRPGKVGIPAKARLQVLGQSGTSSRRQEQDNEGFESERVYSIRFPNSWHRKHGYPGQQSQIEWRGKRWALFGTENLYTSSRRTRHTTYTIKRF